jgi:hypothetical protein
MSGEEVEGDAEQQRVEELRPAVPRGNRAGDRGEQCGEPETRREPLQALS